MVERSGCEVDLLVSKAVAKLVQQREDGVAVAGRAAGALRLARRSRRVDHRRAHGIVASALRLVGRSLGQDLVPRDEALVRPAIDDGGADTVEAVDGRRQLGCVLGVDDDERRLAVLDEVTHLVGREAVGHRDRHQATFAGGVDEHHDLAAVRSAPHRAVATADA